MLLSFKVGRKIFRPTAIFMVRFYIIKSLKYVFGGKIAQSEL